jgi:hypothetical protein
VRLEQVLAELGDRHSGVRARIYTKGVCGVKIRACIPDKPEMQYI